MPGLALRSLWEATTPTPVVVTATHGSPWDQRPRRTRVPLEHQLLALWAAGQITDDELEKLLKGV